METSPLAKEAQSMLRSMGMRASQAALLQGLQRHSTAESVVAYVLDSGGADPEPPSVIVWERATEDTKGGGGFERYDDDVAAKLEEAFQMGCFECEIGGGGGGEGVSAATAEARAEAMRIMRGDGTKEEKVRRVVRVANLSPVDKGKAQQALFRDQLPDWGDGGVVVLIAATPMSETIPGGGGSGGAREVRRRAIDARVDGLVREWGFEETKVRQCLDEAPTYEAAVRMLESTHVATNRLDRQCVFAAVDACEGAKTADDLFVASGAGCVKGDAHRYCYACAFRCVSAALSRGVLPRCPGTRDPESHADAGGACGVDARDAATLSDAHLAARDRRCILDQRDVELIVAKYMRDYAAPGEPTGDQIRELRLERRDRTILGEAGFVSVRAELVYQDALVRANGGIRCPSCEVWVFPPEDGTPPPFRVLCGNAACAHANTPFCSGCRRPYHYGVQCADIAKVERSFIEWQQRGRETYLRELAAEDEKFREALEDFRRQEADHRKNLQEQKDAFDAFQADEKYKASNAKLCPHCRRVVQHMGGCDLMLCGTDYHGGNQQHGCGQKFRWSEAEPYVAATGHLNVQPFDRQTPTRANAARHPITLDGEHFAYEKCVVCFNEITGLALNCIHCAGLPLVCVQCQDKLPPEGFPDHTPNHLFTILEPPPPPPPPPPSKSNTPEVPEPPAPPAVTPRHHGFRRRSLFRAFGTAA
ncbi:hypothetical protein CTAYLR_008609 [Chrysophaeum taylorii]|uniref:Uncharacterized protein n=1 Tax=Chrysophaeum taylorii TaxID=2483200 RepID=A0AAD7XRN9_9STRA|nr:hypothetical protein CTAYLR_008609 [Chrysophaeum taylorii]